MNHTASPLTPFLFGESVVRTAMRDSEPSFVAKDLCAILGISKYRDALAKLEDDERVSIIVDTLGGPQEMAAVNESGLYALIFMSQKPEARIFRKWVTSEVLPTIRRTGCWSPRSRETLAFVEELLRLGFSAKDASILARHTFPPLTKAEKLAQFHAVPGAARVEPPAGPADPEGALFLSIMRPGRIYRVADFYAALPEGHPILSRKPRARETMIGNVMSRLSRLGKVRRVIDEKCAAYELPEQDDNIVPIAR